jgi:hypothetical protein
MPEPLDYYTPPKREGLSDAQAGAIGLAIFLVVSLVGSVGFYLLMAFMVAD